MLIRSPHELAVMLKTQRSKLKLSQKEIGDLVGLRQKTISAIENNPENTKVSTLFRVLSALETGLKAYSKKESSDIKKRWHEEW